MRTQTQAKPNYLEQGAFLHEVFSAKKLSAGKAVNLSMFNGKDEVFGVDYRESGSNPYESGRGAILALEGGVLSQDGSDLSPSGGTTDIARHVEASILLNTLIYEIKRGTFPLHKGAFLRLLVSRLPQVYRAGIEDDTNVSIVRGFDLSPQHVELESANVGKWPVVFRTPLSYEKLDVTFDFPIKSRDPNYVVPNELDNHVVFVRALFLELPKQK